MSGATRRRLAGSAALLVAMAVAAATIGVVVQSQTARRIEQNQRAWEMRHLSEIISPSLHSNDIANDYIVVRNADLLGGDADRVVYRAYKGTRPAGAVVTTVAPRGYSGPIYLLVGVYPDGRVAGVRITAHRETPGLGDRLDLDKSDWLLGFDGRSLQDPAPAGWRVHRDGGEFDQFTGATVTPRAVVSAVRDALLYFSAHRDEIFAAPRAEPSQ